MIALPAAAQQFTISPVVVEVASSARPVAVTIVNHGDTALLLQLQPQTWSQRNGLDDVTPTSELLVVPPIARIEPGARQLFRLALRNPAPSSLERTYRIEVSDITQRPGQPGTGVELRFAHSVPVMVAPLGKPYARVQWAPCAPSAGDGCVRLTNLGNRRIRVTGLTASQAGGAGPHIPLPQSSLLLAGASRDLRLPTTARLPAAIDELRVQLADGAHMQAEPARELTAQP